MPAATLTSKGQITVPKPVRDALGLRTGDRIAFRIAAGGQVTVEAETVDLASLRGSVVTQVRGVRLKEMQAAIQRGASRSGKR